MLKRKVRDLMIPISEYGQVNENATVFEAILELKKSQEMAPKSLHPYRAVLVVNNKGIIVGKAGHLSFLKSLEPKYGSGEIDKISPMEVGEDFISSMMDNLQMMQDEYIDIKQITKTVKVKEIMHPIDEMIDEGAAILDAMHKLIKWKSLSLPVSKGEDITGLIRLSDIYSAIENYVLDQE